ncbi:MAG: diguanylate cyclase [Aquificae bacterium]|nr:diguanylate cyclase [Aquificota bacterium]
MRKGLILKLFAVWLAGIALVITTTVFFVRKSVLEPAKDKAVALAQVVESALTTLMVTNAMDKRYLLLEQIRFMEGVEDLRVIRGKAVIKQYGEGMEWEKPKYPIEKEVLTLGIPREELIETLDRVLYRVVLPYKAEPSPGVDCMKCHKVKPGEVLGAISITMDLTHYRNFGFLITGAISFVILSAGFLTFMYVRNNFKEVENFLSEVEKVFLSFERGKFSARINLSRLRDEFYELGKRINKVIQELDTTLKRIREKVYELIGYTLVESENEIRDTEKIIDELVRISHFKKTIELDATKEEVYKRIESVLSDYMSLDKFSIYEVSDDNTIEKVSVKGRETWCSENIFENADECRAKRTGQDVNSEEFACVCPNFVMCSSEEEKTYCYYCIPVHMGGRVGNVVQIVYEKELKDFVKLLIPYIKGYLSEASPVLESKRLMEQLKKQSYVDRLTGAFNRRFLEEVLDKILAQAQRRNSNIGVLMVDVDFFKQVNDTYGHDAGDAVLKQIADIIRKTIRKSDYLIRYGGEEFLVLLTDVKEGFAKEVAEKIRKKIEETPIVLPNGVTLKKTVSVGVAEFPKDCQGKFWQCVKFADVALYRAKEEGRNKVVKFKPEMWQKEEY